MQIKLHLHMCCQLQVFYRLSLLLYEHHISKADLLSYSLILLYQFHRISNNVVTKKNQLTAADLKILFENLTKKKQVIENNHLSVADISC